MMKLPPTSNHSTLFFQIREVRTEMKRYGGEISGIRAGIKRSTKFR